MRLHLEEFEGQCRDQHRIRRLKQALTGTGSDASASGPGLPKLTEEALADLAHTTLADLLTEFEGFFNERHARFEQAAKEYEDELETRRKEVIRLQRQRGSAIKDMIRPKMRGVSVQTEAVHALERFMSEPTHPISPRRKL